MRNVVVIAVVCVKKKRSEREFNMRRRIRFMVKAFSRLLPKL